MYSQSYGGGLHHQFSQPQSHFTGAIVGSSSSRAQQDGAGPGPSPGLTQQHIHHHPPPAFDLTRQLSSSRSEASFVGKPIHFTEGQFAGRTIRATLSELQAAAFGRKYAKVDRRPLDPPPVAWLRLYEVVNAGTPAQTEKELDYDNIHILGLMCTVELIPVAPPPPQSAPESESGSVSPISTSMARYPYQTPSPEYTPSLPHASPPRSPQEMSYPVPGSPSGNSSGSAGNSPIGGPKQTTALAGTTFVQVDSIPWKGKTSLLFTFADLAVKNEGYFVLQYRFFDIYSKPTGQVDQRIQADCFGTSFRIFSSKEVPPLGASTELTKHLARYGVRVNVRETERKRKKKERPASLSSPFTTAGMPMALKSADRILSDGSDYDDD